MNRSSWQSHGDSSELLNALSLWHKGKRRCHEPIPGDGGSHAGWDSKPCQPVPTPHHGSDPSFPPPTDSQPKALRRLASGPTPCEGDIEVFHRDQWRVLCDSRTLRAQWGMELCQELRCGNLSSSTEVRDPPSMGVTCGVPNLHLCPLRDTPSCSRIAVVCKALGDAELYGWTLGNGQSTGQGDVSDAGCSSCQHQRQGSHSVTFVLSPQARTRSRIPPAWPRVPL